MRVGDLIDALLPLDGDLDVELIAHPAYEDEIILSIGTVELADPVVYCGARPCSRTDKLRSDGKPSRARPNGDHYHRERVVRVSG